MGIFCQYFWEEKKEVICGCFAMLLWIVSSFFGIILMNKKHNPELIFLGALCWIWPIFIVITYICCKEFDCCRLIYLYKSCCMKFNKGYRQQYDPDITNLIIQDNEDVIQMNVYKLIKK